MEYQLLFGTQFFRSFQEAKDLIESSCSSIAHKRRILSTLLKLCFKTDENTNERKEKLARENVYSIKERTKIILRFYFTKSLKSKKQGTS